jgi:hypothetical protein
VFDLFCEAEYQNIKTITANCKGISILTVQTLDKVSRSRNLMRKYTKQTNRHIG